MGGLVIVKYSDGNARISLSASCTDAPLGATLSSENCTNSDCTKLPDKWAFAESIFWSVSRNMCVFDSVELSSLSLYSLDEISTRSKFNASTRTS